MMPLGHFMNVPEVPHIFQVSIGFTNYSDACTACVAGGLSAVSIKLPSREERSKRNLKGKRCVYYLREAPIATTIYSADYSTSTYTQ